MPAEIECSKKMKGRGRGTGNVLDLRNAFTILTDRYDMHPPQKILPPRPSLESCGLRLEQKPIFESALARRPNYGEIGKRIPLMVNCFKISVPDGYVYHYNVEIYNKNQRLDISNYVPSDEKKKYRCIGTQKNRQIISELISSCRHFIGLHPAYDGRKNLYTRVQLDRAPFTTEVKLKDSRNRTETVAVSIKPVHKRDSKSCAINLTALNEFFNGKTDSVPQEALMAVETIFRHTPCMRLHAIGRSFFNPLTEVRRCPIEGGLELWQGHHQSVRIGTWSPLLNLDLTTTVFHEPGPVIDYVCKVFGWRKTEFLEKRKLTDHEIRKISRELHNLKIQTTHLNYKKTSTVIKVTRVPANRLEFTMVENGQQKTITVSNFFEMRHNQRLQYPNLPCVQVSPESKKVYLPMEICSLIEGQHYRKFLTDEQKKEMIKFSTVPPKVRFQKIANIAEGVAFNEDIVCSEFNLDVNPEPLQLQARVFEPPVISFGNDVQIRPNVGQWDLRDKKFIRAAIIRNWILLSFADQQFCTDTELLKFAEYLASVCESLGLKMKKPLATVHFDENNSIMRTILSNVKRDYDAELVVVVLPRFNRRIYGQVKQAAELMVGLKTQCVKDINVKRCDLPLVKNLALKINAKMNGINSYLNLDSRPPIFSRPVIVIGADVSHPAVYDYDPLSVAAIVGSMDAHPCRYAATFRVQLNTDRKKKGSEIILELQGMVVEILRTFYTNTKGKKPEKIIFFRDGVSDGQFQAVRNFEVMAVRRACMTLDPDYKPGVTFIVVQKRHHIRFQTTERDGTGRSCNVPPGTTVDTVITSPTNFDFFQCSHFSPLGTARPCYYSVLEDDNAFSADKLQMLAYHLCYTYAKCTKSISVPAPVMYAHLAAYRVRQWLDTLSTSSPDNLKNTKVLDEVINSMYFL